MTPAPPGCMSQPYTYPAYYNPYTAQITPPDYSSWTHQKVHSRLQELARDYLEYKGGPSPEAESDGRHAIARLIEQHGGDYAATAAALDQLVRPQLASDPKAIGAFIQDFRSPQELQWAHYEKFKDAWDDPSPSASPPASSESGSVAPKSQTRPSPAAADSPAWLRPFESYLSQYPSTSPADNQRFLAATGRINRMFEELEPKGLSPAVERALRAGSPGDSALDARTFADNADERLQRAAPSAPIDTARAAPAEVALSSEGPAQPAPQPKAPVAEPGRFDGRYSAAGTDVLEAGELGLGHKGGVVREIQTLMEKHGAKLARVDAQAKVEKHYGADGYFGEVTQSALRDLQKKLGLPPSGKIGPETLSRLRADPAQTGTTDPQRGAPIAPPNGPASTSTPELILT